MLRIAHLVHLVLSLKHLPGVLFVKKIKKKSSKKSSKQIKKKKSKKCCFNPNAVCTGRKTRIIPLSTFLIASRRLSLGSLDCWPPRFLSTQAPHSTLLLFWLQLAGTFLVLILRPDIAFQQGTNPLLLTTEGEFVIKNLVLISAGLVVGGTVRRV